MRPRLFVPPLLGFSVLAACAGSPAAPAAAPPQPLPTQELEAGVLDASAPELTPADAALDAATSDAPADALAPPPADAGRPSACSEQAPQDFLIRGNFLKAPGGNARAIQYRTDTYGFFSGFGRPGPGAKPPTASVVDTTFMGLPVRMHRKVVPALACVEAEIQQACGDHPYTARALAGIRMKNTYRGGEVTNHAYGIAIDIDPSLNTCCGCVPPWNDAPRCHRPAKTEYDRMMMPECWVHAFERFGFYWLGHDVLMDTMHFEFLGDPDKIAPPSSPAQAARQ